MAETCSNFLRFLMVECVISTHSDSSSSLLKRLSALGTSFLRFTGNGLVDPSVGRGHDTDVYGLAETIVHQTLGRDPCVDSSKPFPNRADLNYSPKSRSLFLSQHFDPAYCDELADGLLRFTRLIAPIAVPEIGFLEFSHQRKSLSNSSIANVSLSVLKWAMVFGPKYIRKYGDERLLGAPCWRSERLSEDCILCVMTPKVSEWLNGRQDRILRYFRQLDSTAMWGKK